LKFNTRSFVTSLVAASLALSLQIAVKADTFHRAALSGRYHLGSSSYATAFNVNAYSTTYSATGATVPGGSIQITSNVLFVNAGVASVTSDTTTIAGVVFKHATVVSKSFSYQGAPSHVIVEMTPYTAYGEAGFQIVRESDGAIVAASWPNGFYQQLPLEYGGMTIL
jgi:hypothetical protein